MQEPHDFRTREQETLYQLISRSFVTGMFGCLGGCAAALLIVVLLVAILLIAAAD